MSKPDWCPQDVWDEAENLDLDTIVRRAILAAKAEEREACAALVLSFGPEHYAKHHPGHQRVNVELETAIAAAIRKRGEG